MAEPRRAAASAPRIEGGRFLIVEARYYDTIGAGLLAGETRALEAAGATHDLVSVAGALEIPAGMAIALDAAKAAGRPYDGAVALGCVVRGETFHFEIVAGESARALMDMSVERKLALGNGILTTDTIDQAEERADPERGDKGGEAARAAVGLAGLRRGPAGRESGRGGARPRASPLRRRSTRWRSPTKGSPTFWLSSRRTGSGARSRGIRTPPPSSPSFATWSPASCATNCRSTAGSTTR